MDAAAIAAVTALFEETFFGVPEGRGTWYADSGSEGALCTLLERVSAAAASKSPGPGRKSVAAHAGHALVHVEHVTNFVRGIKAKVDWNASFEPGVVTEEQWGELRQRLPASSRALLEAVTGAPADRLMVMEAAMGAVAHAAYHLGAIKQILAGVGARAAVKE